MNLRNLQSNLRAISRPSVGLALAAVLALAPGAGRADDRQLLRQSTADPYMFILFDTSGSMNEIPGSSSVPIGSADDPASKFYQAKEALYTALINNPDVHYGFGTFNQDSLNVRRKHYIYKADANPGWTGDALSYPVQDLLYTFGGENSGGNTTQGSCGGPISVNTAGVEARVQGYPRTGDLGTLVSEMWLRQVSGRTFRTETRIEPGSTLGDPTINVRVTRWRLSSCSGPTFFAPEFRVVRFSFVRETLSATSYANDISSASNTCNGMEPNTDSASDRYRLATSINLAYAANRRFDRGDFLPLDWTSTNRDEVLRRLAPNLRGGDIVPDFGIARYLQQRSGTDNPPLITAGQVPLFAEGNTPLGNSMNSFRNWYAGCSNQAICSPGSGWKDVAERDDTLWGCRQKYLLILTDGDETCSNAAAACAGAQTLYDNYGITTFVIAFGVANVSGNVLACLADEGSGGRILPFNPSDQTGLNNALQAIFERVTQESRAFSSAAVPTVQANFEDTIYVPSFTPLNSDSFSIPAPSTPGAGGVWDGHLDAFLKDLPINGATGKPDTSPGRSCASANPRTSCHLWDAGKKLLEQAPTQVELSNASPIWKVGAGNNERRIVYSKASAASAVPLDRRLLLPQSTLADQQDLWLGMGLTANPADSTAVATANAQVTSTIKYTLMQKVASKVNPNDTTFVLGDIFHSNPVVVNAPSRVVYFNADIPNAPGTGTSCASGNKGYRCFRLKHQFRRRLIGVGSNDGQLHLFDAGIYRGSAGFDNGTGKEILSYVPREMLSHLYNRARRTHQDWGVDGTIQVDDVFVDPIHNGTPTVADREWQTVIIGGMREGGSSYYALNVTQPDAFDSSTGLPTPLGGGSTDYVPSCWNGGTGCGTVPFGSPVWNFTDTSDEDGNGKPDLGNTWSTPSTGRIRIVVNAALPATNPARYEDRYVAVFGGGMDPDREDKLGNWLYMVDIETGKAIYKRQLIGSAPSDVAALDSNLDGYIDRLYVGTTQGYLYKASLDADVSLVDIGGGRLRITSADWSPFRIFDTATDRGHGGEVIRPIYFAPSVIYEQSSGNFSVAFGTGDREDLWNEDDDIEGRFFVAVDSGWQRTDPTLPKVEDDFKEITSTVPAVDNYLLLPPPTKLSGWFLKLGENERLISKSLALSGILTFTGFVPETPPPSAGLCQRKGSSNIYTVLVTNANPVLGTAAADRKRTINAFVTNPYVEANFSKNVRSGTAPPATGAVCRPTEATKVALRSLFPGGCKFTSYTLDIKVFEVDTTADCIAPVPVCVIPQNWKER